MMAQYRNQSKSVASYNELRNSTRTRFLRWRARNRGTAQSLALSAAQTLESNLNQGNNRHGIERKNISAYRALDDKNNINNDEKRTGKDPGLSLKEKFRKVNTKHSTNQRTRFPRTKPTATGKEQQQQKRWGGASRRPKVVHSDDGSSVVSDISASSTEIIGPVAAAVAGFEALRPVPRPRNRKISSRNHSAVAVRPKASPSFESESFSAGYSAKFIQWQFSQQMEELRDAVDMAFQESKNTVQSALERSTRSCCGLASQQCSETDSLNQDFRCISWMASSLEQHQRQEQQHESEHLHERFVDTAYEGLAPAYLMDPLVLEPEQNNSFLVVGMESDDDHNHAYKHEVHAEEPVYDELEACRHADDSDMENPIQKQLLLDAATTPHYDDGTMIETDLIKKRHRFAKRLRRQRRALPM